MKIFLLLLILPSLMIAQQRDNTFTPVWSSPEGNYVFLDLNTNGNNVANTKTYTIQRGRQGNFSTIGTLAPVKSYGEFEQLVGASVAGAFKRHIKAQSNEEVVRFFQQTHPAKEYGIFIIDVHFLQAMGVAYLDRGMTNTDIRYKVIDGANNTIFEAAPQQFNRRDLPVARVSSIKTTDSIISIRWSVVRNSPMPLSAAVYKQSNGKGDFTRLPVKQSVVNGTDNQSYIMYETIAQPEQLSSYYVQVSDFVGNEGYPSDTAAAITIDYSKIAGVTNITVNDSAGQLVLQWKPLQVKPYYTGIQVLRSRDVDRNFLVIDTLPATSSYFADAKVLPGVTYFYQLRPLTYKLSGWRDVIATTVHGSTKSAVSQPLPPHNIRAVQDGQNIRLTWVGNSEVDVFAYYVMRGTSTANMEIVSEAVKDTTFLDSSYILSGRTTYLYSVIAINNGQIKSDIGRTVAIRPARAEYIPVPGGISHHLEGNKLVLTWQDMRRADPSIAGYMVYRKAHAEKSFAAVNKKLVNEAFYEDQISTVPGGYDYAVSCVDRFGVESSISPEAHVELMSKPAPPAEIFLRQLTDGVEISLPATYNNSVKQIVVYRKVVGESKFTKVTTLNVPSISYIDKAFTKGKINVYVASVITGGGESEMGIEKTIFAR